MAKDRTIACVNYMAEGHCSKGREGTFYGKCQTCNKYQPIKGGTPARRNLKKEKLNKIKNNRKDWF